MFRPLVAAGLTGLLTLTACGSTKAPGAQPSVSPLGASTSPAGSPSATASAPAPAHSGPCGSTAQPPARYDTVVWIWLENRSYDAALPRMRYLSGLAARCGVATNYRAVTHPSLPNYLAAVSGSTGGVHSDCAPAWCPQLRQTIFDQAKTAGGQWRSYQEGMPGTCARSSAGRYAPKHNPAAYFLQLKADCARWDVPMDPAFGQDVAAGRLPRFAFVTPDLCHDGHDCSVATVDGWLAGRLPQLLAGPDYRRGRTAVFVTWDEDEGDAGNRVATIVIAPGVRPGTRSGAAFSHYSLLRTSEELLGFAPLGAAASAPSMRAAFRL